MGSFSVWHWLIVLAVVLLLFGGRGKISTLMGDFGKGLSAFKKGVSGDGGENKDVAQGQPGDPAGTMRPPVLVQAGTTNNFDGREGDMSAINAAAVASAREILIEARREGDSVLLSVTDRGPGIPESDRKHAIERFVRLEASRTLPGSGLGLSLASAVATLHGGELRLADSYPGLIATLAIPALPAASDRLAAQTQDVPQKVA